MSFSGPATDVASELLVEERACRSRRPISASGPGFQLHWDVAGPSAAFLLAEVLAGISDQLTRERAVAASAVLGAWSGAQLVLRWAGAGDEAANVAMSKMPKS